MLAKSLLPHVGGAPAIWIATMLFFQLILLLGYAYAAISSAYLTARQQSVFHSLLIIMAIAVSLPLSLKLSDSALLSPEYWVLSTLLATIAIPYFALSANTALTQRWFFEIKKESPYFLFGLSNIGGLIGLLSYPLLVEWVLPLKEQLFYWSVLFYILASLLGFIAVYLHRGVSQTPDKNLGKQLALPQVLRIAVYAFIPSSLFLSTTLFITTDISSMPLLWVVPLALYLLSFVVAFSERGERWILLAQKLHILSCALVFLLASYVFAFTSHFYARHWYLLQILLHLGCLWIVAVSCHGQIARCKPKPIYLTSYYFWLALGGVLGGLFNTVAPHLFNDIYEYPLILLLSLIVPISRWFSQQQVILPLRKYSMMAGCAAMAGCIFLVWVESKDYPAQYQKRNFFGVKKVIDLPAPHYRRDLKIGSTLQGYQPTAPEYVLHLNSNLRELIARAPKAFYDKPFAVIGLGTGMLACIAKENQVIDFFEIDPLVIEVAKNSDYFTYLRDCEGESNLILGDGRQKIADKPADFYKLIVLDAFNSSAMPVHLLTAEAVATYYNKLDKSQGLLAFNIINKHMNLRGVLSQVAAKNGLLTYAKRFEYNPNFPYDSASEWVFMVPPNSPWIAAFEELAFTPLEQEGDNALWTDDYSSILPILK